MIVVDQGSSAAVPSRFPCPSFLPPSARRAVRAAEAVSRGELSLDQAGALYEIDVPLLETWLRALSARRARPAFAGAR